MQVYSYMGIDLPPCSILLNGRLAMSRLQTGYADRLMENVNLTKPIIHIEEVGDI